MRLRIGHLLRIPFLVHLSWVPAVALIFLQLRISVFDGDNAAAGIATAGFFASISLHELAHGLTARSLGIPVVDVTLYLFGGVARIAREPDSPHQEALIAIAGPLCSATLGVLLLTLKSPVASALALVNFGLALINLIPGFPLDGGRLLRAALWARSGDGWRAARAAATSGQIIGGVGVVAGVAVAAIQRLPEALWPAVVGFSLYLLAGSARRAASVGGRLEALTARAWVVPFAGSVDRDADTTELRPADTTTFAVTHCGRLAGILLPGALSSSTTATRIAEVMIPWNPRMICPANLSVPRVLERLAVESSNLLIVIDEDGKALGVLEAQKLQSNLRGALRQPAVT